MQQVPANVEAVRRVGEPLIGVIADTHGLLRPEAVDALHGSTAIVHAGDVGRPEILDELRRIAPVICVRGNIDTQPWAQQLPLVDVLDVELLEVDELGARSRIFVLHQLAALDFRPESAGIDVVISGHSHMPTVEMRNGVLYLNPGSAGPRRFRLPLTVARLRWASRQPKAEIVTLTVP